MIEPLRIAFDVGGVLSKYPNVFLPLIEALQRGGAAGLLGVAATPVEVHIISDMHPKEKVLDWLTRNGFRFLPEFVHVADYRGHGEMCKSVLCGELGIHILIDDHMGYLASHEPCSPEVRLLVMPDPSRTYYHPTWETDGSEGEFGRRNPPGSKRPPEDR